MRCSQKCRLSRHARDVVLHISHDAWVEEEKEDIPMRQLTEQEVCNFIILYLRFPSALRKYASATSQQSHVYEPRKPAYYTRNPALLGQPCSALECLLHGQGHVSTLACLSHEASMHLTTSASGESECLGCLAMCHSNPKHGQRKHHHGKPSLRPASRKYFIRRKGCTGSHAAFHQGMRACDMCR